MYKTNDLRQDKKNADFKILIIIMFLPCLLIIRVLDNDVWFLLNSGRYLIHNGIPYIEPFTIHKDMSFVMQQWLTDVIFWLCYDWFGENGLFVIVMLCYSIIIYLLYKLSMMLSEKNFFVSFSISTLASIFIYPFMVTRPLVFTLVLVLIELYMLELYIFTNKKHYLLILPLLSVMLINLQAAMWPMLFIILIPYIIDSFKFKFMHIEGEGYSRKYIIVVTILMFGFGFFNPYGFDSMTYLFKSYGFNEINYIVNEMLPPNINNSWGKFIYLYMIIIVIVYCLNGKGKTKLRYLLLTIGTAYMSLTSIRNFIFFVICSIFPLAYSLKKNVIPAKENILTIKNLLIRKILITLIIIVLIVVFYKKGVKNSTESEFIDLNNSINYLLDSEELSKIILYTGYNDGGYVQYKGIPTYIDPRAEVFVKKNNKKYDIMKEYFDLQYGNLYYKLIISKYGFTHLLLSNYDILNTYLPYDNNYMLVYSNKSYKVYEKIK